MSDHFPFPALFPEQICRADENLFHFSVGISVLSLLDIAYDCDILANRGQSQMRIRTALSRNLRSSPASRESF